MDPTGGPRVAQTYPLAPDFTGCPYPDPDHSYTGGRFEYGGSEPDGFLRAWLNDDYWIGYSLEQVLS